MGIEKYYTETFIHKRVVKSKVNNVNVNTLTQIGEIKGAFDLRSTTKFYDYDKENFRKVALFVVGPNEDVQETDALNYENLDYEVIQVGDPMNRKHHLEILAGVRKDI